MNATRQRMRVAVDGRTYDVEVEMIPDAAPAAPVLRPVPSLPRAATPAPVAPAPAAPRPAAAAGTVSSPLAGTVVAVHVKEGQSVNANDLLVTLEAMKMNTPIRAPSAGTVRAVHAAPGTSVEEGAPLVVLG